MRYLSLIVLCFTFSAAFAGTTVYKEVAPDGSVTFTDKAPHGSQKTNSHKIVIPALNESEQERVNSRRQQLEQSGSSVGKKINNYRKLRNKKQKNVSKAFHALKKSKQELKQAEQKYEAMKQKFEHMPDGPMGEVVELRDKMTAQQMRIQQLKEEIRAKREDLVTRQRRLRDLRLNLNK